VTTSRTRVVLADDDVLLREGLAGLLERSGFEIVGQCGDASELIALVREHRPDLAVVDIRMPPSHSSEGLEAARVIREEFPQTAILVLSAHVEVEQATDLLASGERSGYLLKSRVTDVDEFVETLERIVRGGSVVDPALVQELVAARRAEDPLDVLSPRELEVLSLMAEDRSNAGIARQLWVTEGTVEKHVHSILTKLRLPATEDDQRRVLAVITFLDARSRPRRKRRSTIRADEMAGGLESRFANALAAMSRTCSRESDRSQPKWLDEISTGYSDTTRSASSRTRTPTSRPSDVVTGRLLRFCSCIRPTIASSRALGLTVLGPGVIASSTLCSCSPRSALRPNRPMTMPAPSTTKHVSQPAFSTRSQTCRRGSSRRHVGTSQRTCAPARVSVSARPSSGRLNEPQSALPAA
jgi:DNA-binding NarL/FixJ family response regulator